MQTKNNGKEERIFIRIQKYRKENWKKLCSKRQISLSSLIIDSVEGRIFDDERRKILAFIEKQDNIFAKVENNINQIAKIANIQKFISKGELKSFSENLKTIIELKEHQNVIFTKIYSLIVMCNRPSFKSS
ncbi:hypothetical protein ELOC111193_06045 [Elizabethkingia occulta]|uniref:Bacterial mobilisation domain-containing protein n=1 Tax=Elizabethkingia occulta TaxID=1867263 RepID=A0A1T3MYF4_9FLAO|nr:hypothetical protein [Elizabethkingia occulta]OPC69584.1 hypothetical protein BAZ10_16965 [Elizabethkingia occulta]